ncbi:Signal recognition particle receptor FtsY [Sulfitobacter indolifex]|uniref:Signal recognition particle receptor FtsY n=1 Tax=Sulfitobacter indolifex HEL-45 TaxID=391624 RepID=A0ABP2DA99_9RHOB|nr:signal recognition particle-docking protein FtsY [Sulfitobacter indolifex]EDQ05238.1 signal recognition particle-docking protein FtsY [Sulfitobacter indolifex HEL-45]UOA18286.1 Signal recognition particle receptor FtsY [Sulfitobacter indolifex]
MAFFTKLKDRLFKSSSKIDEGLEAIVSDGGDTEAEAAPVDAVMDQPGAASDVMPDGQDDSGPMLAAERDGAEEPEPAPEPDLVPTPGPTPDPVTIPDPEPQPAPPVEPQRQPVSDPEPTPEPEQVPPAVDPEPTPAPSEVPPIDLRQAMTPVAPALDEAPADAAPAKPGLLGRLMGRNAAQPVVRRTLDDDMLEQLEELLISADMGVDTALRVTANMAEGRFGKKLSVGEIKQLLATEVSRIMEPVARPLPIYSKTPQVVLVVGVNGSGKTTTIGKLASQFRAAGKKVVIAAGDTFRAAAVEQLQVWGERAGVPVLTAAHGSDPASLAFDAMGRAQEEGADLLLIDTAGRLQNRGDLMEELAKIVRVIRKKDETAPHNTLLVLDATTGQNALNQVKVFQEISDVSGLVMTKLDGTAKGGVLVALADRFGLPIHAVGVGEQIDDLSPFDPDEFAAALVGIDA